MQRFLAKITNDIGLHARPASLLVSEANRFSSEIRIRNLTTGSDWADAKSILSVLSLGVEKDHEVEVIAEGADAEQAVQALNSLIQNLAAQVI